MKTLRLYECEFYKVLAPTRSCLFCDHCTDVFYDFANGPYMFLCDINEDTVNGALGECAGFCEDGGME